jgi:hypothetical protein
LNTFYIFNSNVYSHYKLIFIKICTQKCRTLTFGIVEIVNKLACNRIMCTDKQQNKCKQLWPTLRRYPHCCFRPYDRDFRRLISLKYFIIYPAFIHVLYTCTYHALANRLRKIAVRIISYNILWIVQIPSLLKSNNLLAVDLFGVICTETGDFTLRIHANARALACASMYA